MRIRDRRPALATLAAILIASTTSPALAKHSKADKPTPCEDATILRQLTLESFGYSFNLGRPTPQPSDYDRVAKDLADGSTISVVSQQWQGDQYNGTCSMKVAIALPPERVADLGGEPVINGDVKLTLTWQGYWTIYSLEGREGGQRNPLGEYLQPYTKQLLTQRQDTERSLEHAARRRWEKEHPTEHAAQIREEALRQRQAQAAQAQLDADNDRKRRACEANGGTWGYRTRNGFPIGDVGCFFQTIN